MYKAYKFRIYPNKEQEEIINKTFGSSRYVYNYYLEKIKNKGYISVYTNIKDYTSTLKYQKEFLKEIDDSVIIKTLFNLDNAYKKTISKGITPKYKNKYNKNSYNIQATYSKTKYSEEEYCNIELDLINKQIKLPKLKQIKIRGYKNIDNIEGKIKNVTISREQNGKYYISVLYKIPDKIPKTNHRTIVGIDLGIKKLLTLSDGTTYDNNKYIDKYEKRIKRKQRELARKEKGSKNYYKCKKELAVLYSKLANARKYYIHKITKAITDEYDIITCEKLQTKKMIINGKNNKLSSKINDATFSEIVRQLLYKSKYKGKAFYQIDTYYPSSQICSSCNNQSKQYKDLTKREYKCTKCGTELDRDLNASINIMFEGLKLHIKTHITI